MSRKPSSGVPLLITSTLVGIAVAVGALWLMYWFATVFLGGVA